MRPRKLRGFNSSVIRAAGENWDAVRRFNQAREEYCRERSICRIKTRVEGSHLTTSFALQVCWGSERLRANVEFWKRSVLGLSGARPFGNNCAGVGL